MLSGSQLRKWTLSWTQHVSIVTYLLMLLHYRPGCCVTCIDSPCTSLCATVVVEVAANAECGTFITAEDAAPQYYIVMLCAQHTFQNGPQCTPAWSSHSAPESCLHHKQEQPQHVLQSVLPVPSRITATPRRSCLDELAHAG